jgi:hypothetical protein
MGSEQFVKPFYARFYLHPATAGLAPAEHSLASYCGFPGAPIATAGLAPVERSLASYRLAGQEFKETHAIGFDRLPQRLPPDVLLRPRLLGEERQ